MSPLRILLLEDVHADAELAIRTLKGAGLSVEPRIVEHKEEFENALNDFHPDVILSDHSLPAFNSMAALALAKERASDAPFILVTGTVSEEFAAEAIKAGADDYLLKDRLQRLPQAITQALERRRLEKERRLYLEKIIEQEKLQRAAERLAHLGSFRRDLQTNTSFWSDELFRLLRMTPGEVEPSFAFFKKFIHPDDVALVETRVQQVLNEGASQPFTFRLINARQQTLYLLSELGVEKDEQGRVKFLTGFLQDVTQARELEEKVVQEKAAAQQKIAQAIVQTEEQERSRIGRELHDNVNQILSSANLYLRHLQTETASDHPLFDKVSELLRTAVAENRKLSHSLTSHTLLAFGLNDAISDLIESACNAGIATVDTRGWLLDESRLTEDLKMNLYRIVQEQLTNIAKHAKANAVTLSGRLAGKDVIVVIADDGVGFDPSQKTKGIGLSNIQNRAALFRGSVEVESAPGKGTKLTVRLTADAHKAQNDAGQDAAKSQ